MKRLSFLVRLRGAGKVVFQGRGKLRDRRQGQGQLLIHRGGLPGSSSRPVALHKAEEVKGVAGRQSFEQHVRAIGKVQAPLAQSFRGCRGLRGSIDSFPDAWSVFIGWAPGAACGRAVLFELLACGPHACPPLVRGTRLASPPGAENS